MAQVTESIDVNVPIRTAYDQWTQFEGFPQFMGGVQQVTQLSDTRLHWKAEIAGRTKEWDAEITEQTPDQRVAWTSTSGARNAGVVSFQSLGADSCRVQLQMDVEPEGPLESAGASLGLLQRTVKDDLEKFKGFIESRGQETGAWRGQVSGGQPTSGTPGSASHSDAGTAYGGSPGSSGSSYGATDYPTSSGGSTGVGTGGTGTGYGSGSDTTGGSSTGTGFGKSDEDTRRD